MKKTNNKNTNKNSKKIDINNQDELCKIEANKNKKTSNDLHKFIENKPSGKNGNKSYTAYNEPLVTKKCDIVSKNNIHNEDFFDATLPLNDIPIKNIDAEIAEARHKAEEEKKLLERIKNTPKSSKKAYKSSVIACIISISILFILSLVFFLILKWYPIGLTFAIITIISIQIWIMFFKKINKNTEDYFEDEDTKNEKEISQHIEKINHKNDN